MKKIMLLFTAAVVLSLFSTSCSDGSEKANDSSKDSSVNTADENRPSVSSSADVISQNPDAKLIYELEESMYAGIALMKEGERKATDPTVKSLATQLVTEHSKLTTELEALSTKKSWPLPAGEPASDMQKREAMAKEDVSEFQKDWLAALRDRHETNIRKLENAQPSDPDVKAAGEKGLPKIKELLGKIKLVQANLK